MFAVDVCTWSQPLFGEVLWSKINRAVQGGNGKGGAEKGSDPPDHASRLVESYKTPRWLVSNQFGGWFLNSICK